MFTFVKDMKNRRWLFVSSLRKTPLYPIYERYGAKTIDFGGWELPVQYSSIKEEHHVVRTKAGLFDVSHMGELSVRGADAETYLQKLVTNDVTKLTAGRALYTPMCYPDGGTVDDVIIYKKADEDYLVVVNAANIDKDLAWMSNHIADEQVTVDDMSAQTALLALQGPLAESVLQRLTAEDLRHIKFFRFKDNVDLDGIQALVSRTGYTGEDGFEIYLRATEAIPLWEKILEAGKAEGVQPCGLGARDTLRFEAGLPLYGQELSPQITPVEAGLGFAVKPDKGVDFIGRDILRQQKEAGPPRKLVGIEMIERGIPRSGYAVYVGDQQVGQVTSGTHAPTLNKNVGMALIETRFAHTGQEVHVHIRKKRVKGKVVPIPFYKRA